MSMARKKQRWQIARVMANRPEYLQMLDAKQVGNRLFKIRFVLGYGRHGQQKPFAEKYGFEPGSWSHWEKGRALIPQQAVGQLISAKECDGLTSDYIYFNRFAGMPLEVRRPLEAAPDRKGVKLRRPGAAS
jgi:hypothetical protein